MVFWGLFPLFFVRCRYFSCHFLDVEGNGEEGKVHCLQHQEKTRGCLVFIYMSQTNTGQGLLYTYNKSQKIYRYEKVSLYSV